MNWMIYFFLLINFSNSRMCITTERATRLQSPVICVAAVRGLSVGALQRLLQNNNTTSRQHSQSAKNRDVKQDGDVCAVSEWGGGSWRGVGGCLDFKVLTNEERARLVRDVNSFLLNLPTTLRLLHRLFSPECLLPTFISSGPKAHKHTPKCGRV